MAKSPNVSISLIEASLCHAELLAALHDACFEVSWSVKEFQELLILPTVFGLIVQPRNDAACGFILCRAAGEECEILSLAVLPKWRRQGMAARLLEELFVKVANLTVATIFLEVAENNKSAFELYLSRNFQEVGRRPGYYHLPTGRVDALILAKKLL